MIAANFIERALCSSTQAGRDGWHHTLRCRALAVNREGFSGPTEVKSSPEDRHAVDRKVVL